MRVGFVWLLGIWLALAYFIFRYCMFRGEVEAVGEGY